MFNPHPTIQALPILPGEFCYVIDDALQNPDAWVQLAADNRSHFEQLPHNAYPGLELRMPPDVSNRLDEFFAQHIRKRLGARRTLRMYSRLSMVTLAPAALEPRQWICHRDHLYAPPEQCIAASVLYLFKDAALGGTSFYAPRQPGYETDLLVHDASTLGAAEFQAKRGLTAGYMTESNAYFDKVLTVPAKWNRLIFYNGCLFHSSDLKQPPPHADDPTHGRLTLNGFFTCSRAAQPN